jgi:hypothetical protein
MYLKTFINSLPNLLNKINKAAGISFRKELMPLLNELRKRSPKDKGIYQKSWILTQKSASGSLIGFAYFQNVDSVEKAFLLEYGAEQDTAPWYYPGAKRRKSGKLTVAQGRVWAGGLDPGHQLTIGGAIDPVIYKNPQKQQEIAENIGNAVIGKI